MLRLIPLLVASLLLAAPAFAQTPDPAPEDLRTLADLLRKPAIQDWLAEQAVATPPAVPSTEPVSISAHMVAAAWLDRMHRFLQDLAAAAPTVGDELARAWLILSLEFSEEGLASILILLATFAALGFGLEWLYRRATADFRRRIIAADVSTPATRLRAVGWRAAYGFGELLAYAVGSIGAFLLFDWPPLLRHIVLGCLVVVLIVRLVLVAGHILLAPGAERFRIIPMATASAKFWLVWSAVIVGYFLFVQITLAMLAILDMSGPARYLTGISLGLVLLALALFILWRHPGRETGQVERRGQRPATWLFSLYFLTVWLLLFTGSPAAFYGGVVLILLPIAMRSTKLAVDHLLRPAEGEEGRATDVPAITAVALDRGLRAALLIGGAYLIAHVLGLDFGSLASTDTMASRFARGVINAVVILLVADFAWHLGRAWIDSKLAEATDEGPNETEEARRRARLRTLLPLMRSVLFAVLLVIAGTMALAALGVEVGPLIAGAGVVGIAIGFGAQTLVRDILSGFFFLLDDAFRIGEYIESGDIRGTVEAFSLRSMKLRHHRGALHTIPFGALDKITNYSRDWVIDKMTLGVSYTTDLDKVKAIIKKIGKELAADPEFAPHILETLKMQGVEQFGDFAIQIRLKMMTRPGEQFVIRRRAYALIKKAFAANGIEFAFPTVTVAGGGEATPAVAQRALDLVQPAAVAS
jgi:small-conductance mechanosensitive channel